MLMNNWVSFCKSDGGGTGGGGGIPYKSDIRVIVVNFEKNL